METPWQTQPRMTRLFTLVLAAGSLSTLLHPLDRVDFVSPLRVRMIRTTQAAVAAEAAAGAGG
jgi:hypothetical protein